MYVFGINTINAAISNIFEKNCFFIQGLLDRPAERTNWTDQLNGPARQTSWMDQFDGSAGGTSWTDQFSIVEALDFLRPPFCKDICRFVFFPIATLSHFLGL